ncbi:MAG: phage tail sheath protein [Marmoricola sp.]|nr:phage tail sheath protein [Marmoricola sp.]
MTDWLHPEVYVEELPPRPVPIRGDGSVWKYVNVRRLLMYVERSIEHALQWVVFEPNGEPLCE